MLTFARVVAAVMSLVTFAYLFLNDSWRADNAFLVPDLVLCALLLAGAVAPATWAPRVLLIGFSAAAGIFGTSVSSYAVDGEFGVASAVGVLTGIAMAVVLARQEFRTVDVPAGERHEPPGAAVTAPAKP